MNQYGVFLGLDVGKSEHHAVGLDPTGQRLHDAPLPNVAYLPGLAMRRIADLYPGNAKTDARDAFEVGALLDAEAAHGGRSAYNHLRALAMSNGILDNRVRAC